MNNLTKDELRDYIRGMHHADTEQERWKCVVALERYQWEAVGAANSTYHLSQLLDYLRLIWDVKVFNQPHSAVVRLSPYEYLITLKARQLLRPIQNVTQWSAEKLLICDDWDDSREALMKEPYTSRWRRKYFSARCPNLLSMRSPIAFAKYFLVAVRTNDGLWWQSCQGAWPMTKPMLRNENAEVGFVIFAHLDPQWYRQLPFNRQDLVSIDRFPKTSLIWSDRSIFPYTDTPVDQHLSALLALLSEDGTVE